MIDLPHSIAPCPILVMACAELGRDQYQFLVIGLTQPARFDSLISQNRRWVLYSFGHPVWLTCSIILNLYALLCSNK